MARPYSPIRKMLPATKSGKTSNSCMNSICKMRDCPGAQTCHANPPAYLTESKDLVIRVDKFCPIRMYCFTQMLRHASKPRPKALNLKSNIFHASIQTGSPLWQNESTLFSAKKKKTSNYAGKENCPSTNPNSTAEKLDTCLDFYFKIYNTKDFIPSQALAILLSTVTI